MTKIANYFSQQAKELKELLEMPTSFFLNKKLDVDAKTACQQERELMKNQKQVEQEYENFLNLKY